MEGLGYVDDKYERGVSNKIGDGGRITYLKEIVLELNILHSL